MTVATKDSSATLGMTPLSTTAMFGMTPPSAMLVLTTITFDVERNEKQPPTSTMFGMTLLL